MKQKEPQQDQGRKKQASDFLKNADRYLKSGDYISALEEVERTLEVDPGNFYAIAYKERIVALKAKNTKPAPKPGTTQSAPTEPHSPAANPKQVGQTQEEHRKQFLEEKRRLEDVAKKDSQEARHRMEEELRRRAFELEILRQREDEERRQLEAERKKLESKTQATSGQDSTQRHEEQSLKRIEEEERTREEEARRNREAEALAAIDREALQFGRDHLIQESLERARQFISQRNVSSATEELMKLSALDHHSPEVQQLEQALRDAEMDGWQTPLNEAGTLDRTEVLRIYADILSHAWIDGMPDAKQDAILGNVRSTLEISVEEHRLAESEARVHAYREAFREVLLGGGQNQQQSENLARIRKELTISDEQHLEIESQLRKNLKP